MLREGARPGLAGQELLLQGECGAGSFPGPLFPARASPLHQAGISVAVPLWRLLLRVGDVPSAVYHGSPIELGACLCPVAALCGAFHVLGSETLLALVLQQPRLYKLKLGS